MKKRSNQKDNEKNRRRQSEWKNVAKTKRQEKAMLNRQSEGGQGPLDRGKNMLGAVRMWAITEGEEYFADPAPNNIVIVLDGGEWTDYDEPYQHCTARWAGVAERVLPLACHFTPAAQANLPAEAASLVPAPEVEAAAPDPVLSDEEYEEEEEGVAEEEGLLHALYVLDYSNIAPELAGETSHGR